MSDYGQAVIDRGVEPIDGTWEFDGDTHNLRVEALSYGDWKLVQQYAALSARFQSLDEDADEGDVEEAVETAEDLDDFSWEDPGEEVDFVATLINNTLEQPEIDPESTAYPIVSAIVEGMMEAWQESPKVAEAKDEMPVEGNR